MDSMGKPMIFSYTLAIHSEDNQFDYYEVHELAFSNPVSKGDSIEYRDVELEVFQVLHEVGGNSYLHVKTDEKPD